MTAATPRRVDEADLVILELVRLTVVDSWTLPEAVRRLLAKRHTPAALRVAQDRVQRARAEHAGVIADRAALTISRALADHVNPLTPRAERE
jgi:hypothetical protein